MQDQQPQYYRTVKASERLPEKEGRTIVFRLGEPMIIDASRRRNNEMVFVMPNNMTWRGYKEFHWLEPIPMPDAERLREALEQIANPELSGVWSRNELIRRMQHIAHEALSAGDGWIEIKEGCDMPDYGDSVLVIIPNHGDEYFNAFTAKYEGDGFYVKKRRVDDKYFAGEPSHWRPLPPQPIKQKP